MRSSALKTMFRLQQTEQSVASPATEQLLSWSSSDKNVSVLISNHWHATNSLEVYFCQKLATSDDI